MESEFGFRRFRDHAVRKLLAASAPSPVVDNNAVSCDEKIDAAVSCRKVGTFLIVLTGMVCLTILITFALLLLCCSVARRRRIERERREANGDESPDQTTASAAAAADTAASPPAPEDSPKFADAVLVQLPGDEKPQFFALPKPFLADDALHQQDDLKKPTEVALKAEEKDPSPFPDPVSGDADSEHDPANPVVGDASIPSPDGHLHNPLFPPR